MSFFVDVECNWLNALEQNIYEDIRFQKIVRFFVINTPVLGLSARTIDLKTYGWTKPWNKKYYLNRQLKELSTNPQLMFSTKNYEDMEITLEKAGLLNDFPSNLSTEVIVIYNNKNNQFISTFSHIRNSLAHGRFNINCDSEDWIFVFEDGIRRKNRFKLSARIVLKLDTLLAWVKLIEGGECEYIKY